MREICLDEGTTQSYLDGELSLEMTEQVAGHIATCEACAGLVREAEGELSILSAAFADELALPVPSEQLRVRINRAIDALATEAAPSLDCQEQRAGGWRAWLNALFAPLTARHAAGFGSRVAGFASLIALMGFGLIFFAVYRHNSGPVTGPANSVRENGPVAMVQQDSAVPVEHRDNPVAVVQESPSPASTPSHQTTAQQKPVRRSVAPHNSGAQYLAVANRREARGSDANDASPTGMKPEARPTVTELPGEKSYLKTIASLTTAIDADASLAMQPTLRAEYERNLALVNQAIASTRPVALSKPGDQTATQFLYSAYQSKIDLLSAVADRQSEAIARR